MKRSGENTHLCSFLCSVAAAAAAAAGLVDHLSLLFLSAGGKKVGRVRRTEERGEEETGPVS